MIDFDKWYLTNNSTRAELLADIAELTQTPYYKIIDGTPELLHAELIMIQSNPLKIKYRTKYYPKYHKAIVEKYLPSITTPTKSHTVGIVGTSNLNLLDTNVYSSYNEQFKKRVYKAKINDNEPLYKVKGENNMDIKELLFKKRSAEEAEIDKKYEEKYNKFLDKTRIAKTAVPFLKEAKAISEANGSLCSICLLSGFVDDSLLLPEEREKKQQLQKEHNNELQKSRDKYDKIEFLYSEAKGFKDKIKVLYTYNILDITEASGLLMIEDN